MRSSKRPSSTSGTGGSSAPGAIIKIVALNRSLAVDCADPYRGDACGVGYPDRLYEVKYDGFPDARVRLKGKRRRRQLGKRLFEPAYSTSVNPQYR